MTPYIDRSTLIERRRLISLRDTALTSGDIARYQELNRQIVAMTPCPDCGKLHDVLLDCHGRKVTR